jgi:hypothetical protein
MTDRRRRREADLDRATHEPPPRRGCDWPTCACAGEYRAPKGRDRLREFYFFCLEHVRAYNRAWDFFADMNQAEIESYLREDITWHRPSWPLGAGPHPPREGWRWQDPYDLFLNGGLNGAQGASEWDRRGTRMGKTERMLAELDLNADATREEIKARYKQLVKRHHPDLNDGDKRSGERLKLIIEAYRYLVDSERFV